MADVFISYSRRDEPFVERLREALAGSDKDVWLDREDIGPAVEWSREIELGIEGAWLAELGHDAYTEIQTLA